MGMFDEIQVDLGSLPDPPEFMKGEKSAVFQTKDLECMGDVYEIHPDGSLRRRVESPHPIDYHGYIHFYTGNTRASGPSGEFTDNGEDAEWVEYRAKFTDGFLVRIDRVCYTRTPAKKYGPDWITRV